MLPVYRYLQTPGFPFSGYHNEIDMKGGDDEGTGLIRKGAKGALCQAIEKGKISQFFPEKVNSRRFFLDWLE